MSEIIISTEEALTHFHARPEISDDKTYALRLGEFLASYHVSDKTLSLQVCLAFLDVIKRAGSEDLSDMLVDFEDGILYAVKDAIYKAKIKKIRG